MSNVSPGYCVAPGLNDESTTTRIEAPGIAALHMRIQVLTTNPLQQGLKLHNRSSGVGRMTVLTTNPLQQGLKLRTGFRCMRGIRVLTTNPLQQGLKLNACSICACSTAVLTTNPLQQGLKPFAELIDIRIVTPS